MGSEYLIDIWVGDPRSSIDGTLISGYVYAADDGFVTAIHDHSGRADVYPWRLLAGPVLRMTARMPGKRRKVIYAHPEWAPRRRP